MNKSISEYFSRCLYPIEVYRWNFVLLTLEINAVHMAAAFLDRMAKHSFVDTAPGHRLEELAREYGIKTEKEN